MPSFSHMQKSVVVFFYHDAAQIKGLRVLLIMLIHHANMSV